MSAQYRISFNKHGEGWVVNEKAGENLGLHKLVYRNAAGTWSLADADTVATMPVLGITMGALGNGMKGEILLWGYIGTAIDPTLPDIWSWAPGVAIYASTVAGELTQTMPIGIGDVVQVVAIAIEATLIHFMGTAGAALSGSNTLEGETAFVGFDPSKNHFVNYFLVDGVADDVQTQAAVTYVSGLGGGSVMMEAGNYSFTSPVSATTDDIMIKGVGYETTITQPNGTNLARFFYFTGDNCRIRDLYIDGNKDNNITGIGVEINGVTDFGAFYVKVRYAPSHGFYIYGNSIRVRVHRCVSRDNSGNGLYSSSVTDSFYTDNTLTGNNPHGLFMSTNVGMLISGNQCLINEQQGINAFDCAIINIADNIVNSNKHHGIRLSGPTAGYNKWNNITGNTLYGNSRDNPNTYNGIHLDTVEVKYNIISDNLINGDTTLTQYGIGENLATLNLIENNFIVKTATASLNINAGTRARNNFVDDLTNVIDDDAEINEVFIPVSDPDAFIGVSGTHPAVTLVDGGATNIITQWYVPFDLQQLLSIEAIVVPGGTGNMRRFVDTQFGKVGSEDYNANTDLIGTGQVAVTANKLEALNINAAFTDVSGGDLVGIKFSRNGAHVDDTVNADCYFLGIRVRYI